MCERETVLSGVYQSDALSRVQHTGRPPGQLEAAEAAHAGIAGPERLQRAAPVGHGQRRVGDAGEVRLPVAAHVAGRGLVERVVGPGLGHAVGRLHAGARVLRPRPAVARCGAAEVVHPCSREVAQARRRDVAGLWVAACRVELGALYGYVEALHAAHAADPGWGVVRVQDQDEARAVARIPLLPQDQKLVQTEGVPT